MLAKTMKYDLLGIKFEFSIVVFILALTVILGSFFFSEIALRSWQAQSLNFAALQYRIEYDTKTNNTKLFSAISNLLSTTLIASGTTTQAGAIPVLTYHSVLKNKDDSLDTASSEFEGANISLALFKDQMFALKEAGWKTITYEELEQFLHNGKSLPQKSFLLTFDDGAKASFYPVDPILNALDYTAVAFILPAHSLGDKSTYYLNRDELTYMLSTGRWEFESHGQDIHTSLPITPEGLVRENALSSRLWLPGAGRLETHEEYAGRITNDLKMAQANLQNAFGISVRGFAFPFGDYGQNANNDSLAEETILETAKKYYTLAFYQNWNNTNFSFNYPELDSFMVKRIPVNPTWDGKKLLSVLETGIPKDLSFEDTFKKDEGWRQAWGQSTVIPGALSLKASTTTAGALAFLDGSYPWSNYRVDMSVHWTDGYAILLFDLKDDRTGRACVFASDGSSVQLQERTKDEILILREVKIKNVTPGKHTIGAVSNGTTSACLFDNQFVIDARLPELHGGIGVEIWSQDAHTANLEVLHVTVNKI